MFLPPLIIFSVSLDQSESHPSEASSSLLDIYHGVDRRTGAEVHRPNKFSCLVEFVQNDFLSNFELLMTIERRLHNGIMVGMIW